MKILYVAKHGSGGNDDEGAIAYALEQLGHDVVCVQEADVTPSQQIVHADLILFHKWQPRRRYDVPTVFWYFDLVNHPDPSLRSRCNRRIRWMREVCPLVDLGFCTDGDWVESFNPMSGGKLVWLPQGADERVVGMGTVGPGQTPFDLLFTGIATGGGKGRVEWVRWCERDYGDKFHYVRWGLYREGLRDVIANTKIVLCPDSPVTDRYWSNRVYNAAGFGAVILHPYCMRLVEHFTDKEIVYYQGKDQLRAKINLLLDPDSKTYRLALSLNAMARVLEQHLYRHRCQTLIATVRERLGI